jgi:hypothetical protein
MPSVRHLPVGLLALALLATSAQAQVTFQPFDLIVNGLEVFNDRIGNSRFFTGPNTDRVRVSARAFPSSDSDGLPFTISGLSYRSTNGYLTSLSLTHASMGALPNPSVLTEVGLLSGRGGGRNEYTISFNRANAAVAPLLDAWVASPFSVTATNPATPNGITSQTVIAPPFDKTAVPPFVTDLKVTTGTKPTMTWLVPASAVPLNPSVQVRRVDAVSADGTRITAATLIHAVTLPVGATSYTFNQPFSVSLTTAGFPSGFIAGQKYEIAVQLDIRSGGALKGRARTLFEYTPLPGGGGGVAVYLPSLGTGGAFKFDISVAAGATVNIDPATAVGYIYETGAGDPNFRSVTLPNVGDGRFTVEPFDAALGRYQPGFAASAGASYDFTALGHPGGVARFRVKGIEASAGIDVTNTTAFVTGVAFMTDGRFTGTMTPIGGYQSTSFLPPLNLAPTVNTTRAGATLPLKWVLLDQQAQAVTDLAAIASISFKPTSCSAFTDDAAGASAAMPTGGSRLRYDHAAGHYVFNWKTPNAPGCHSLFLTTDTQETTRLNVMLTQ